MRDGGGVALAPAPRCGVREVDALLAYEATCAKVRAERQAMAEARAKAEARLAWLDELAERDAAKAQAVDRGD